MDSGFNQFFTQIPTGLIVMFCGSGILLVFSIIVMVNIRSRKAQAALAAASNARSVGATRPPMVSAIKTTSEYDMPDVDDLLTSEPIGSVPAPARIANAGTYSVRTADGEMLEVVEVLSVLRDVAEGGLLIQIGDQVVRNPPALADSEFKRRFNSTVSELAKSLSTPATRPAPPPPKPTPVSVPVDPSEPTAAPIPVDEPPLDVLTDLPPVAPTDARRSTSTTPIVGAAPGDLPKFNLGDNPLPVNKPLRRVPKPTNAPIPEINVGGSVEAYLQHRLSITPEFAGRSIHIVNSPKGELLIEVDGKHYDSISDVEDIDAKLFLAETIEEWQSRQ